MRRPLFAVALCLVIVCTIQLWSGGAEKTGSGYASIEEFAANGELTLTGQVYQKEEDFIYLKSIVISDSNAFGQSAAKSRQVISNRKIICYVDGALQIPMGATVVVQGKFMPFSGATNPGAFDARKYYRSIGIVGKLEDGVLLGQGRRYWPVREWLHGVKQWLTGRIYEVFPEEDAAVIEALILGEKDNLDSELKGLYQRNGILHILSISAMHVSIVGLGVYKLLRKWGVPIWLASVCGSIILLLYGGLTGFGISAVRAIGMYLLRMLGEVVGRTYDMLTALGLVGALMVLYNPYYLQNGGFILSFSCVLGIGVLYPALLPDFQRYQGLNRALDTPWKRFRERLREAEIPKKIVSSFLLSMSVTLATLPVQLYLYYEVPVFSVLLNLLVIPFLKPLMIAGMVALALPWLNMFENIVGVILEWYELACSWFDALSYNTWNPGCPEVWQLVAYYGLLLLVILWRKWVKACKVGELDAMKVAESERIPGEKNRLKIWEYFRRALWFGRGKGVQTAGCATLLVLGIYILGVHPLQSKIIFLDVGQGSCAVMQLSSGENYVFDCGSTGRSKVGQYVLLPYLKYAGIHRLDGVFVSHPDEDHSNGVLELFQLAGENDIVVEQLILPDIEDEASKEQLGELVAAALAASGTLENRYSLWSGDGARWQTRVAYISRGDSWRCDSANFLCLHPYKDYSGADSNQYSQCIYVEFFEEKWFAEDEVVQSLLLTGDVGKGAEADLLASLEEYGIGSVNIYQGAHHGSKYSNSGELLQRVRPDVTIISCGQNNSYGHPHKETLARLKNVGSVILTTPEYGAIEVEIGGKMAVRCWGR